jgi:archaellum component FlaC
MSQSCVFESCESTLGISCHCCDKTFCPDHLDEHYESIHNQLKPLVNEINALNNQIMTKTKEKLIGDCLDKLNEWRDESYKTINSLYENKRQELEEHYSKQTDKQQKEIDQMQTKINKLIHEHDATEQDIQLFKSTIEIIKHQIKEIHQISFHINIRSLELDENFISIEQIKSNQIDFTVLVPPYKTIDCSQDSQWICASNENALLIRQDSELHLISKELTIIKKIPFEHNGIYDICWSSILKKFILINFNKGVYLSDESFTSIEQIKIVPEQFWWRCACSDNYLYLISSRHGTDIFQFDLLSSFQLIKRSKLSHLSQERDKIIDITYNNETLALLIKNQHKTHMELRSCTTFDRLWLLQLDIKYSIAYCCSLNCNDWLLLDHNNSRLIHVTENGNIKSTVVYNARPENAILFDSDILAIKTEKCWNFHKI